MFPRTDGALKLKYFNIFLPSNMIRNFTESYTLASDEPEPELGPETGPDAIISSSEGKGENIGPQRKQPGDNYCVSCSALLPPLSLFLCESHFQYCLQINIKRESVLSRLPLYLMWGVTHKMMKWFSSTEARAAPALTSDHNNVTMFPPRGPLPSLPWPLYTHYTFMSWFYSDSR